MIRFGKAAIACALATSLVTLALLSGCATTHPKPISLAPPAQAPEAQHYLAAVERYSRHGHILSDFDETLTVDATLLAPRMVAALAAKHAAVYKLTPEQAAVERAKLVAETAGAIELHVETAAHNYALNDLASTKTVWKLSLLDDQGHAIDHPSIRLGREQRDVDAAFYPYTALFGRPWTVRFPLTFADGSPFITPSTRALILRIAGPNGTVDLTWQLER
jgi:hypothetical protein